MHADPRILELALAPEASLDDLLALAGSRHPVRFESVCLGDMTLDLLQIADLSAYIDRLVETARPGERLVLPFWAKLWPASLPLAMLISRLRPGPGDRLVELGAGLGLCGLTGAKRGYRALITDIEPEALLFIRAAILKNGLDHTAKVGYLNIADARCDEQFEVIAMSEALYLPALHEPLAAFLAGHLSEAPGAQALISCDRCREAAPFFAQASKAFSIQRTQASCRSGEETQTSVLFRMQKKAHA
ncbi:hypothetical protein NNJEOMEG_02955 [Fundidesulfovibrio magnetotacticus]|uniref:Methyltransferase n=1 Tax=Fundidesulfovibrio magnetotacticus TaxID=2730080 RepID=A0A6V8LWY8_9BACT|nr:methyltransferase [Fundidesulfovibrio magnetotacticus]GFK95101.1 hypothetical protein NNJEOMEG_02955 [Fundidesulfovibrio magnetotacticus]